MSKPKIRTIILYKNHFNIFYHQLRPSVRDKIIWTFKIIEILPRVPVDYLKHLEGTTGLYEIRIKNSNDQFRVFCFFDQAKSLVLLNGFQKKTQKTPRREIEKAMAIKSNYEKENNC